jgi:hypothetical protein
MQCSTMTHPTSTSSYLRNRHRNPSTALHPLSCHVTSFPPSAPTAAIRMKPYHTNGIPYPSHDPYHPLGTTPPISQPKLTQPLIATPLFPTSVLQPPLWWHRPLISSTPSTSSQAHQHTLSALQHVIYHSSSSALPLGVFPIQAQSGCLCLSLVMVATNSSCSRNQASASFTFS